MPGEKEQLKRSIKEALTKRSRNEDGSDSQQILDATANEIAEAVDAYVKSKLNSLSAILKQPACFQGSSPTGAVIITPNAPLINYNPNN